MTWLWPVIGLGVLVVYELWSAITHEAPTISQYIWSLQERYRWLKYLVLAGLLVLAFHFYGGR